jgi:hypothetical protein
MLACLLADMSVSLIAGPSDSFFADKQGLRHLSASPVVAVFFVEDPRRTEVEALDGRACRRRRAIEASSTARRISRSA